MVKKYTILPISSNIPFFYIIGGLSLFTRVLFRAKAPRSPSKEELGIHLRISLRPLRLREIQPRYSTKPLFFFGSRLRVEKTKASVL
jgi:hypothetical protein